MHNRHPPPIVAENHQFKASIIVSSLNHCVISQNNLQTGQFKTQRNQNITYNKKEKMHNKISYVNIQLFEMSITLMPK